MKASTIAKAVCAVSLSALCVVSITACSGNSTSGSKGIEGVAATVNGAEIQEKDVTDSVESIRSQMSLTDEDAWGEWMAKYDYTPEKVREEVIDSLVTKELIIQGAEEKGVTVSDDEVQSYVDQMKQNYASDDKWNEALQAVGMTEDQYKDNIKTSLLQQGLLKAFEGDDPSDEDVLSYAQTYISSYDGAKRSSHILFDADDEATAQSVLDQINAGTLDFAEAAKTYSKDSSGQNGGDVGWDKLNSFVSEYTAGLADLSKGQVSGLVTSSYGIHIIKCTDEFHAPAELTSLDQLPSEFVDQFRSSLKSSNQSKAYQQWLSDAKENADIEIKDMPSGLPYDLDMSKYQSDDSSDSSDSSSTDGSSSSADNEVSAADASSTSGDSTSSDSASSDNSESETKKAA
ncbi:SurA N-terminal domain-containing protein [uncultured Ellagibacter sp.]|uniref:SurA N-terminal domain-containing protein n=1 Tax=uncultured Ellagibacter sp. TaxID=2137580 RepID=UPI00262E6A8B|nr:SurA N-terminal domain-containing protein [uncultured Ellagibacter sp.]